MDQLLHHCIRELSFDGDLGCNVSRLRDFIVDFYTRESSSNQNVDDAFCGFVWSLIVRQPTVRVGTIPEGVTSEVWIAPQVSARRKANARGEELVETKPAELNVIPDAHGRPLDELARDCGDDLRIAVHPEFIYAAITGSHVRLPTITPMVYSALQVITRGREEGVTMVQLGQQSGYDQKTCFYLVQKLTDHNLVVKLRRGGVSTHTIIHKYFYDRSASWAAIREEEAREQVAADQADAALPEDQAEDDAEALAMMRSLKFSPIDARHLSSSPLVRGRLIKLLKASQNQMHAANNILLVIGFAHPTKSDRRFFNGRVREMIRQGIIERVEVPSNKRKGKEKSVAPCLRLVDENAGMDAAISSRAVAEEDEKDFFEDAEMSGMKMNVTVHKQLIDLIEESDTKGMTLSELSAALANFDRRTVELVLSRAAEAPPPSHLADLGVVKLEEHSGREKRHRYYTQATYQRLIAQEVLVESTSGLSIDPEKTGGFASVDASEFYDTQKQLRKHMDHFEIGGKHGQGSSRKVDLSGRKQEKRKQLDFEEDGEDDIAMPTRKKKRPAGTSKVLDTPSELPANAQTKRRRISKVTEEAVSEPPRKRGRPRKHPLPTEAAESTQPDQPRATKRKRGRPRKAAQPELPEAPKRKRGRPRKHPLKDENVVQSTAAEDTGEPPAVEPDNESLPGVEILDDDEEQSPLPVREETLIVDTPDSELTLLPDDEDTGRHDDEDELAPESVAAEVQPVENTDNQGQVVASGESSARVLHMGDRQVVAAEESVELEPSITNVNGDMDMNLIDEKSAELLAPKDPAKRRGRPVNVSALRRQNEFLRVLTELGGMAHIGAKEFYDTHMKVLEDLATAGEPSSAPVGTRTDKRTVAATCTQLENQGRIKTLKTYLPIGLGPNRAATIAYLPHISEAALQEFVSNWSNTPAQPPSPVMPIKRIEERLEYGSTQYHGNRSSMKKVITPLLPQPHEQDANSVQEHARNTDRVELLWEKDDAVIRDVLLNEKSTISQFYGFIIAKGLRCRELHIEAMKCLEAGTSAHVASSEDRILDISHLYFDLPVRRYLQLVSPLHYHDDLNRFLATQHGPDTLLKDLPRNIHMLLQIGKSRPRARVLDLLRMLQSLNLVVPVRPCTSSSPVVTTTPEGSHPESYEIFPSSEWSIGNALSAPTYWMFSAVGPIHAWAVSESDPPFVKDMPVTNAGEVANYWDNLKVAALSVSDDQSQDIPGSATGSLPADTTVGKSLRRSSSWSTSYFFTWHQKQYLKKFVDFASPDDPLHGKDGESEHSKNISWVISAPVAAVQEYFTYMRGKVLKELGRAKKRDRLKETEEKEAEAAAKEAADKESLVQKAAEARQQKQRDWDNLLARVAPHELSKIASVRIQRIRKQYLDTAVGPNMEKWESQISTALKEAETASKKVLKRKRTSAPSPAKTFTGTHERAPLSLVGNPPEKSVKELIAQQGPARERPKPKQKAKEEQQDEVFQKPLQRRYRFQWNRDYDELARDGAVIIKARCRDGVRLDWGAFEQVFPNVHRNSVRQRLTTLRASPGSDAYLNRLEDRWFNIWTQYHGTPELPDDTPVSATEFDLPAHIEFLRKHIDKNALRVGYTENKVKTMVVLPSSIDALVQKYDIFSTTSATSHPTYDFVWNDIVEESRERKFLNQCFSLRYDEELLTYEGASEDTGIAESIVKMVFGTPSEAYNPEAGSKVLHEAGKGRVSAATKRLLDSGVLSKLVRDPTKQRPGRQVKISEPNQNALGGSVNPDLFLDAAALEELSSQDDSWRDWPLLATDGDLAALAQSVSDNKAEFRIDTTQAQAARPEIDWNSKKADDDQIETSIQVRFLNQANQPSPPLGMDLTPEPTGGDQGQNHGSNGRGEAVSCARLSDGVTDCAECLEDQWAALSETFNPEEARLMSDVYQTVSNAGEAGISPMALAEKLGLMNDLLFAALRRLVGGPVPLVHVAGYTSTYIVASSCISKWTAKLPGNNVHQVLPRRWLDISGNRIPDVWEAALRAVMGAILFRAGITTAELRWRLQFVYDRQEINDILHHLAGAGFLKCRCDPRVHALGQLDPDIALMLDGEDEKAVYWFLDDSQHWYLI